MFCLTPNDLSFFMAQIQNPMAIKDIDMRGTNTNSQGCELVCKLSQAKISNTSNTRCRLVVMTIALNCTKLSPSNLKQNKVCLNLYQTKQF